MDDKDFPIEIRIRDWRKKRELSQEELADKLGISRQSIISLEQGRSMPSLPLAVSLCQFFDTAFEDIFEFEREVEEHFEKALDERKNIVKVISNNSGNTGGKESTMMGIEPWRPLRESVSLREAIDHLFEDSVITPGKIGAMPKIDIRDQKGSIVVRAEIPGLAEEDVNVEILDNVMTISGEKKEEKEEDSKGYYYKESHTGSFSRSFTLPSDVRADKAEAEVKNGILVITVPKIEPKKAQKITVKKK